VRRSLDYRGRSGPAHLLAARLYRQMEAYEQAEEHLQRCKELQGGTTEELQLENLMLRACRGDPGGVLEDLAPYIDEKRPEGPLILEAMAVGFTRRNQNGYAFKSIEDWSKLEPDNPWPYYQRGNLALASQNASNARVDFEKALDLNPDSMKIRRGLVEALLHLGEFDKAIKDLEKLIEREPDNYELVLKLAHCNIELGGRENWRYQRAEELLDRVLEKEPDSSQVHFYLGQLAYHQNRLPEALQQFRLAVRLNRLAPPYYLQLYNVCRALGMKAEAAEHFKQFKSLDTDFARLERINHEQIRAEKKDPNLYYEAATIYFRHGRMGDVLRSLKLALHYDSNHVPSHKLFVDYYTRVGDYEMAHYHREQIGGQ
jgi:tetratricopeptide (TPR) repeat protein